MHTRQSGGTAIAATGAIGRSSRVVVSWLITFVLGFGFCLPISRTAAAQQTFTVTNADDGGSGSLRVALDLNNLSGGSNTIVFDSEFFATPRAIRLDGSLPNIGTNVTINGPGANLLTIVGDGQSRVMAVNMGVQVNLNGVTITGGNASAAGPGGLVGGGISNGGTLTITGCHITGNRAAFGGGISNETGAQLIVKQSTISNNVSIRPESGGGIFGLANVIMSNSTVSGNVVTDSGGGGGGGLWVSSAQIDNSTITNNSAAGRTSAGGIQVDGETVTLVNTIIAGNANNGAVPDVAGSEGGVIESDGFNLIGNPGAASFTGSGFHDQRGSAATPLDPLLSPLQDNGGPTPTHALLPGSPALDQGASMGAVTDQRGVSRPFDIPGIAGPADQSDIGAVEMHALFVTNANASGAGSLSDVVTNAADMSDIVFDPIVFDNPQTISTAAGEIDISKNLTIIGPGAHLLTLSGGSLNRIFRVANGGLHVEISDVTFSSGETGDVGGAVVSDSNLALTRCALVNNQAANAGGAVYVGGSVGTFRDCTFSGNTSGAGGAVLLASSSGSFTNCTISGNTASGFGAGGGIWFLSGQTLAVINSTIVNNAGADTGGIRVEAGTGSSAILTLRNSIVANNTGPNPNLRAFANGGAATITSLGYNLTNDDGGGFFTGTADQTNTDPMLGPLQNHGGSTATHMPLGGSPALDKGNSTGFPFDQRGRPRAYDIANIAPATGGDNSDIGAVEAQAEFVTNANDIGDGSLRQVIADAPANSDILFDESFSEGVRLIGLASGEIPINKNLTINGPRATLLNLSGGGLNRIFDISSSGINVAISGVTFSSGRAADFGGAISSNSDLALAECALVNNQAVLSGGAVFVGGSRGTFANSTFSDNTAQQGGGGAVVFADASGSFTNCTVSGNTANGVGAGGGIFLDVVTSDQKLAIRNSTIVENSGTDTGGMRVDSVPGRTATATFRNSIIANNMGANPNLRAVANGGAATITSLGYNLTSDNGGGLFTGTADQTNEDPMIGPLQENGGPTQTHALLPGSPAIDQGESSGSNVDQRGFPRPVDDPSIVNATGGDGADIGAFELGLPGATPTPTTVLTPSSGTPTVTPTPGVCVGDCNLNGMVTIDELVFGVALELSGVPPVACESLDGDNSDTVSVGEIETAIEAALQGCP